MFPRYLVVCVGLALLSGCAQIRVGMKPVPVPDRVDTQELFGELQEAASLQSRVMEGDPEALKTSNEILLQAVLALQANGFQPITNEQSGSLRKLSVGMASHTFDPALAASCLPAQHLKVRGLRNRVTSEGLGIPHVLNYLPDSPYLKNEPGVPPRGLYLAATAILKFQKTSVQVLFVDPLEVAEISSRGRSIPLAYDFSAPLASTVASGPNRSLDIQGLLWLKDGDEGGRLFQLNPYRKGATPVVLVHGLMSRPETWTHVVNQLMEDPVIRKNYQFWVFRYRTGLPVWTSAALLDENLNAFNRQINRNGPDKILIGHSMGGILSSLLVRETGEKYWSQFSREHPDNLSISPATRNHIRRLFFRQPRTDVSRVIFAATPHRGSYVARESLAHLASRVARGTNSLQARERQELMDALHSNVRHLVARPLTSVGFLQAESPLLESILKMPLQREIPYHSIIGDRGRGDTPQSSDGIVPYWSSHLSTAVSEKIVPSGHGAHTHPEGIEEIRRILREHAGFPLDAEASQEKVVRPPRLSSR